MRTKRFLAIALMLAMLLFSLQTAIGEMASEITAAVEAETETAFEADETAEIDEDLNEEALPGEDAVDLEDELIGDDAEEEVSEAVEMEDADLFAVLDDIDAPDVAEYSADELDQVTDVVITTESGLNQIVEGETLRLFARPEPADVPVQSFVWSSSNEDVASVSTEGLVTANCRSEERAVTITATAYLDTPNGKVFGKSGSIDLEVVPVARSFTLKDGAEDVSSPIPLTEVKRLDYAVTPADAVAIAKVAVGDADLLNAWFDAELSQVVLEPVATGYTTLTVTSGDGKVSQTYDVVVSINGEDQTDLTLDIAEKRFQVGVGKSISLNAQVLPKGADVGTLKYSISKSLKAYATVSATGVVKGVKAYTKTIKVTITSTGGKDGKINTFVNVTVAKPITKVTVSGNKPILLEEGEPNTLQLTAKPTPATNKASQLFKWTSADPSVATVDENGLVTAVGFGSTKVTATAQDGSKKAGSVTVKVGVKATGITLTGPKEIAPTSAYPVAVGKTITLKAGLLGENAVSEGYKWSSSSKNATVSTKGVVKGVKAGTTPVTITVEDKTSGQTATYNVQVVSTLATKVTINGTKTANWDNGENTLQLSAAVSPTKAAQAVVWTSDNEAIATVDQNGLVTAKRAGVVKIKATTLDGSKKSGTATVTFTSGLTAIVGTNLGTAVTVGKGKTVTLKPVFDPVDTTDTAVKWESADKTIATVSTTGVLKGVKVGETTITIESKSNSDIKLTIPVTVTSTLVKSIKVVSEPADVHFIAPVEEGAEPSTLQLTAQVTEGAAQTVLWSSSNSAVATVDANGLVAGVPGKDGQVTITATATDGTGVKGTYTVYVRNPVTEFNLLGNASDVEEKTLYVPVGKTVTVGAEFNEDATMTTLTWKVKSKTYATVTTKGVVKGVKKGTTTLTATTKDGTKLSDTLTVRVIAKPTSKVVIDENAPTFLFAGSTANLTATLSPDSRIGVNWSSSDESVLTVDKTGKVTAVAKGTATITAAAKDTPTKKDEITIAVGDPAKSIEIFGLHAVAVGGTTQLTARVMDVHDNEIENCPVTWEIASASASDSVGAATVNKNGLVTGVTAGMIKVLATATGSGLDTPAEFYMEVTGQVQSVAIYRGDENITDQNIGLSLPADPIQLIARVELDEANASVTWTSSDATVVKVDAETGIATPLKVGSAVITATAKDGSDKSAQVTFSIMEVVVSKADPNWTLHSATPLQLKATVSPSAPVDSWTSSNPEVATIDANGVVTLVAYSSEPVTFTASALGISGEIPISFESEFQWATNAGVTAVTAYTGNASEVTIPEYVNGVKITEIGNGAFQGNTAIQTVNIPNRIARIGASAFANCSNLSAMEPYGSAD